MNNVQDISVLDFLEWLCIQLKMTRGSRPDVIDILQGDGNNRYILEDYANTYLEDKYLRIDIKDLIIRFACSEEFTNAQHKCGFSRHCNEKYLHPRSEMYYLERKMVHCCHCRIMREAFYDFIINEEDRIRQKKLKFDQDNNISAKSLSDTVRSYCQANNLQEQPAMLELMYMSRVELSEELDFFDWMDNNVEFPAELRKMPYSVFEKYVDRYIKDNQKGDKEKKALLKSYEKTGWERLLEKFRQLLHLQGHGSKNFQAIMERYYSKFGKFKCIILPLGDSDSQDVYRSLISKHWSNLNDCTRDHLDIYYSESDTGKTGFDIASKINNLPSSVERNVPCLALWEHSITEARPIRIRNLNDEQLAELIFSIVGSINEGKGLNEIIETADQKVRELQMENKSIDKFFNINGNNNVVGDRNAVGNGIVNGDENTVTGNVFNANDFSDSERDLMDFDYAINVIKETPELNDEMKKQVIEIMKQAKEGVAEKSEKKQNAAKSAFDIVKPFLSVAPGLLSFLANIAQVASFFGLNV